MPAGAAVMRGLLHLFIWSAVCAGSIAAAAAIAT
ncbi:MAG: hypothetical protein GAK34_01091 [Delftia tsuruhatensis]|nr:MAG: hypothetical protein GAK34_01091 [Delftia tsuruhatensis]